MQLQFSVIAVRLIVSELFSLTLQFAPTSKKSMPNKNFLFFYRMCRKYVKIFNHIQDALLVILEVGLPDIFCFGVLLLPYLISKVAENNVFVFFLTAKHFMCFVLQITLIQGQNVESLLFLFRNFMNIIFSNTIRCLPTFFLSLVIFAPSSP